MADENNLETWKVIGRKCSMTELKAISMQGHVSTSTGGGDVDSVAASKTSLFWWKFELKLQLVITLVDKEYKILRFLCNSVQIPFPEYKMDKESGNSCKLRLRRMHSIEMDLEGILSVFVFLVN